MACWGMGITQSDEFQEVYDRFLEEYDQGKDVSAIKKDIFEDYLMQFDADDAVLHDVYFAIGKAEWMCGGISAEILDKIAKIIETGDNIAFLRELEASEKDLRLRKKNLESFLFKLSTPRSTARKRRTPPEKYTAPAPKPKLPLFKKGDIFAYKVKDKYRILCFISRGPFYATYAAYCYVWTTLYGELPSTEALADGDIMPLGYFTVENMPDMKSFLYLGNDPRLLKLDIGYPHLINEVWKPAAWVIAKEENLSEAYPSSLSMKLCDVLCKLREGNIE